MHEVFTPIMVMIRQVQISCQFSLFVRCIVVSLIQSGKLGKNVTAEVRANCCRLHNDIADILFLRLTSEHYVEYHAQTLTMIQVQSFA